MNSLAWLSGIGAAALLWMLYWGWWIPWRERLAARRSTALRTDWRRQGLPYRGP
jgi:hypothetical protein